jgi:Uma2 family endonuclease
MTADELLKLNLPDKRTELVRGKLVVREPAGFRHGAVANRLARVLSNYVEEHALGLVVAAETGFILPGAPQTVRAPDVGFVSRRRIPDPLPTGYLETAPDLAVEVLSPEDRPSEVAEKVADWVKAGTTLVWVVDPARRLVRVHRADGSETELRDDEVLTGESVAPGFACPLGAIWSR